MQSLLLTSETRIFSELTYDRRGDAAGDEGYLGHPITCAAFSEHPEGGSGEAGAAAAITLSDEAGRRRAAADGREWAGSNDRQHTAVASYMADRQ